MLLIARGEPIFSNLKLTLPMIVGIILADAIGRVFYQRALTLTDNDNGFAGMFQNLEPAIAALIAFCLSPWIEGLRFETGWPFFVGSVLPPRASSSFHGRRSARRTAKKNTHWPLAKDATRSALRWAYPSSSVATHAHTGAGLSLSSSLDMGRNVMAIRKAPIPMAHEPT